jgi:hypothetical protein
VVVVVVVVVVVAALNNLVEQQLEQCHQRILVNKVNLELPKILATDRDAISLCHHRNKHQSDTNCVVTSPIHLHATIIAIAIAIATYQTLQTIY